MSAPSPDRAHKLLLPTKLPASWRASRRTNSISSMSTLCSTKADVRGYDVTKLKLDLSGRLDLASKVTFEYAVKGFVDTVRTTSAKSKQIVQFQQQFSKSRADILDTEAEHRLTCPLSTKRLLEAAKEKLQVEGRNFDNRIR
mmetsp:Transcript_3140/g.6500  ORF Transcript_3140/g.6500 Transcript_3140/m.6500 type:complete len:142 (-) Transcript_3140:703-1128(-)